jgi:hypothetical protein
MARSAKYRYDENITVELQAVFLRHFWHAVEAMAIISRHKAGYEPISAVNEDAVSQWSRTIFKN